MVGVLWFSWYSLFLYEIDLDMMKFVTSSQLSMVDKMREDRDHENLLADLVKNDPDTAIKELTKLINSGEQTGRRYSMRGQAYMNDLNYSEAAADFHNAYDKEKLQEYQFDEAIALEKGCRFPQAITVYESLPQYVPDRILYDKAVAYHKNGNLDKAIPLYDAVGNRRGPWQSSALFNLAVAYASKLSGDANPGDNVDLVQKATDALTRSINSNPEERLDRLGKIEAALTHHAAPPCGPSDLGDLRPLTRSEEFRNWWTGWGSKR
jgi:tetratricopeptide (TPR) repeat protein